MTAFDWFMLMCGSAVATVAFQYTAPAADLTLRDILFLVALAVTVGSGGAWIWSLL